MTESAGGDWERRYDTSLRAEDERQGRVPGRLTSTDLLIAAGGVLPTVAVISAGVGWLGTKAGLAYGVGAGLTVALLVVTAFVLVLRRLRRGAH